MNPQTIELEQALIGSVLIDPGMFYEVSDVSAADFLQHKHRWIWEALGRMTVENSAIDILTLTNELECRDQLNEIGGSAYLVKLLTSVPSSYHAHEYARSIKQESKRRKVLELATRAAQVAMIQDPNEFSKALTQVTEALLLAQAGEATLENMGDLMRRVYGQLQLKMANPDETVSLVTGLVDLDATVEFIPGELVVLPGESGVGKTILALQWAQAWAERGNPGVVFEMELSAMQLGRRLSSVKSRVEVKKIRHGQLSESEMDKFITALDELSRLDVMVSESTQWNTITLRASLTRMKYERKIKWFVLDYFDLLQDGGDDPNMRDTVMARNLKSMCKDLEICGVVIHTLNKAGKASGSNKIIYAADNVLHLAAVDDKPNVVCLTPNKIRDDSNRGSVNLVRLPDFPCFGTAARF